MSGILGDVLGAATGGIFNLIGGLFGKSQAEKINEQNIAMQKETNALQYKMFHENQDWNLNMWNKQNEYNTASAQKQRLIDAGMNPLFYGLDGNSAGAIQSVSQPSIQSPKADLMPALAMQQSFANIGNISADAALKIAQANSLEADVKKTESETNLNNIDSFIRGDLNSSILRLNNVQCDLANANVDLTIEQRKDVAKHIEELDAQINRLNEQTQIDWSRVDIDKAKYHLEKWSTEHNYNLEQRKVSAEIFNAMSHLLIDKEEHKRSMKIGSLDILLGRENVKQAMQMTRFRGRTLPYLEADIKFDTSMHGQEAKFTNLIGPLGFLGLGFKGVSTSLLLAK
ncbi:minor capsid protein [Capybara microvirus Cap1_SP_45]|nr:minor capsid protein [Capybara microvirus Cap1_SP_45]